MTDLRGMDAPVGSPHSRIVIPGVSACDGWPRCRWEGRGAALRAHKRECGFSDDGALYRVLRTVVGL